MYNSCGWSNIKLQYSGCCLLSIAHCLLSDCLVRITQHGVMDKDHPTLLPHGPKFLKIRESIITYSRLPIACHL